METESVVLEIPKVLYNQYKERAEQTHRSIQIEIIEAMARDTTPNDQLSPELEELVTKLKSYDTASLRKVAKSKVSKKIASRVEDLHYKRQATGTSEEEEQELETLMNEIDRVFVLRNEAISLLIDRGQDVSE